MSALTMSMDGALKMSDKKKKTIQISVVEQDHDLKRKAGQLKKFHEKGHPVRLELRLRGWRQTSRTGDAMAQANRLLSFADVEEKKVGPLKWANTTLSCHIHPQSP